MTRLADKLTEAIAAHSRWKANLKTTIETGKSTLDPDQAAKDDRCDLGRWIIGEGARLPAADKGEDYATVRRLHAEFHKVAAVTLAAALRRDREAYERDVGVTGAFTRASAVLVNALVAWRNRMP